MTGRAVLLVLLALFVLVIIAMVVSHRKLLAEMKSAISREEPSPKEARWKTGAALRGDKRMGSFKRD
jgi:heme exporter protein D